MYDQLWVTIQAGDYELPEITHRIDVFYAEGKLNDQQRVNLIEQAYAHASIDGSRPNFQDSLKALSAQIARLSERVCLLEAEMQQGSTGDDAQEYPQWQAWDGISQEYQMGDIVVYKGKLWKSVHNGQNVWPPDTVSGVPLWEAIT